MATSMYFLYVDIHVEINKKKFITYNHVGRCGAMVGPRTTILVV